MLARIAPEYSKNGAPHFTVSSTPVHPLCTIPRRCLRIGVAKSTAFAPHSSPPGHLDRETAVVQNPAHVCANRVREVRRFRAVGVDTRVSLSRFSTPSV